MNSTLMDFLEHLLCFNLHFTITSAKRSVLENKSAGGVPNSQHLFGEAIDMKPYGSTTYGRLLEHIHNYSDKENYFDIQSSVLFDDLSVKNKNVHNFSSTGKSWAKIHLKHTGDNTTKLDIVKSIGKSGCEECCSSDYQQFVGNLDTSYYCINDANTNFEVTYFKQFSSTNGKKNAITPFMDTVEILIEY